MHLTVSTQAAALPPPPTGLDGPTTWEDHTYPQAPPQTRAWLREQRGLIRAFLLSPHGRTETSRTSRRGRHPRPSRS